MSTQPLVSISELPDFKNFNFFTLDSFNISWTSSLEVLDLKKSDSQVEDLGMYNVFQQRKKNSKVQDNEVHTYTGNQTEIHFSTDYHIITDKWQPIKMALAATA